MPALGPHEVVEALSADAPLIQQARAVRALCVCVCLRACTPACVRVRVRVRVLVFVGGAILGGSNLGVLGLFSCAFASPPLPPRTPMRAAPQLISKQPRGYGIPGIPTLHVLVRGSEYEKRFFLNRLHTP